MASGEMREVILDWHPYLRDDISDTSGCAHGFGIRCGYPPNAPIHRRPHVEPAASSAIEVAPQERVEGKTDLQRIQESYSSGSQSYRPSVAPGEAQREPEKSAMHTLKTWPSYFAAVKDGSKRFELRVNDREFLTGDWVCLQEWDPDTRIYSGREMWMRITYIAQGVFGLPGNVCVMSIEPAVPSEVAPSREHRLEDALREVLDLLSFHEGSGVPAGSGNSVIVVNEEDWNTALRVARAALEAK